jgi:hypothetical protein
MGYIWCPALIFKKLPYIIICSMFFSFIWFIFVAYSVTGYHKTCLTFSNFCKCSIKVIIALSVCGQLPLHPIWQLIRGCQSRSPESGQTATLDLFRILLPNCLNNGNNNNICGYKQQTTNDDKQVRTCICTAATAPQKAVNDSKP